MGFRLWWSSRDRREGGGATATGGGVTITSGGDRNTGLDRFGRVVDQNWVNTSAQTFTAVDRLQYGYDNNGNVFYKNNLVSPQNSELFAPAGGSPSGIAYDGLGRLTNFTRGQLTINPNGGNPIVSVGSPSRTQSWSLDALGNATSTLTNGATTGQTFNAQNQIATNTTTSAPLYDSNGNETKNEGGGLTYIYDAWNRLYEVENSSSLALYAVYNYDALGRRTIEYFPASGTSINCYYSAQGQVIEERWGPYPVTSPVQYQNVWGVGYVNELVLRDQFATNGTLSQRLYVLQDANYDVTALVDTSGVVQERFVYDPYGAVSVLNASWGSTTDSFGWRYEFQGGRSELVTGWVGFDNRDYIPSEARWAQQDPLGLAADNNSYRFVGNNPIDFTDPTGFAGNSPYNKPIPGMPTPNGDGPMFSPFGQTPYMIPNKPTNSSNAIFFVGPPGRTSTTPDVNDTYMFKTGYAAALGVPPENIFYYNLLSVGGGDDFPRFFVALWCGAWEPGRLDPVTSQPKPRVPCHADSRGTWVPRSTGPAHTG